MAILMHSRPLSRLAAVLCLLLMIPVTAQAERIKELADIEGVRGNALVGYGLVVGLNGTGDSGTSSPFTINSITAMLERLGVNVRADITKMKPKNIAAVMVTSELPAFARPGQQLDVTVSSIGDAKDLRGGTLLITPLLGGDGRPYAIAQGGLSTGGFSVSGKGASSTKGHPTAARVPNGARVERAAPRGLSADQEKITLNLHNPDFTTAKNMQDAINADLGKGMARAIDSGTVQVWNPNSNAVELIARLEQLDIGLDHAAVVIVDERTGTIVMGQEVRIDTVAVAHGSISVNITENPEVSQPNAFAGGKTTKVDRTKVSVEEEEAKLVVLPRQVSLATLVTALNAVGATPSDLIAVLQAIKAAGALHAELRTM
ncbi:MAG: flagellar biosynthesis protein FlgA [Zetaproteobacteria bacterium CG12_big_fil_rev_8_21_14_0_65_54_13]|nr:MAG: flagellar biosynthesis protein FlgA [Zetaproteobacteria bacterium CG12_big_fil_rev_8_21_14_0_65_54_13]PIX55820.1 MAG: flagellar biosynthesis protein FlgA [Zetaproteobacteria bacterium CG_4_10_14_3_um_filter_54_28]PJA29970.1 MAG: flagellar biosynthesis protein FlgA [Zetaproteobacteria bacterium CG_4_9_14_3_um_filter_54_145]